MGWYHPFYCYFAWMYYNGLPDHLQQCWEPETGKQNGFRPADKAINNNPYKIAAMLEEKAVCTVYSLECTAVQCLAFKHFLHSQHLLFCLSLILFTDAPSSIISWKGSFANILSFIFPLLCGGYRSVGLAQIKSSLPVLPSSPDQSCRGCCRICCSPSPRCCTARSTRSSAGHSGCTYILTSWTTNHLNKYCQPIKLLCLQVRPERRWRDQPSWDGQGELRPTKEKLKMSLCRWLLPCTSWWVWTSPCTRARCATCPTSPSTPPARTAVWGWRAATPPSSRSRSPVWRCPPRSCWTRYKHYCCAITLLLCVSGAVRVHQARHQPRRRPLQGGVHTGLSPGVQRGALQPYCNVVFTLQDQEILRSLENFQFNIL